MVDNAGSANGYVVIELRGLTIGQSYIISMTWDNNAALDSGYNHRVAHKNGTADENGYCLHIGIKLMEVRKY